MSNTLTCSPISYKLNTATLTLYHLWHIRRMCGVKERVVAPLVLPAVALVTVNLLPSWNINITFWVEVTKSLILTQAWHFCFDN